LTRNKFYELFCPFLFLYRTWNRFHGLFCPTLVQPRTYMDCFVLFWSCNGYWIGSTDYLFSTSPNKDMGDMLRIILSSILTFNGVGLDSMDYIFLKNLPTKDHKRFGLISPLIVLKMTWNRFYGFFSPLIVLQITWNSFYGLFSPLKALKMTWDGFYGLFSPLKVLKMTLKGSTDYLVLYQGHSKVSTDYFVLV